MATETPIPVSPDEVKKLKAMIVEATQCMSRIDGEKEAMKDIIAAASEKFGIKKPLLNKLARTMYKHNFANLRQENEAFEQLYESLTGGQS